MQRLWFALVISLSGTFGCASLTDAVVDSAVSATGHVAGNAVENAGDRATNAAINKASEAGSSNNNNNNNSKPASSSAQAATHMDPDDVLVLDGTTYLVGKVLGSPGSDGTAQVLVISDGRKLNTRDYQKVRAPSKTELTVGADVYYTRDEDVRRGRWAKGSVTDTKNLSSNKVDIGAALGLDSSAQVVVPK